MYGGISLSILHEIGRDAGVMYQLELDLGCPPWFFVNPRFFTSEQTGYSYYSDMGGRFGVTSAVDHPYFTSTRELLGNRGFIKIEKSWSNGDRVLKPFFFNNVLLIEGEQFSCATAMTSRFTTKYNDGKPMFDLKNYKND